MYVEKSGAPWGSVMKVPGGGYPVVQPPCGLTAVWRRAALVTAVKALPRRIEEGAGRAN